MKSLRRTITCILLVSLCFQALFATRKVRVGYFTMHGFQEYSEEKGYSGFNYEYLQALAPYAGWEYEFVPVKLLDGISMLENGDLDLMGYVPRSLERKENLLFSDEPYGEGCTYLVSLADDRRVAFGDFAAISTLNVGLVKGVVISDKFLEYCKLNNCTPHIIYFDTQAEVTKALKNHEVDASLLSSSQNVPAHILAKFAPEPIYLATTKGNTELKKEMDNGMQLLQTSDFYLTNRLYNKYYGSVVDSSPSLSAEEKAYVAAHPVLKVCYDPTWFPITYRDEKGKAQGLLLDYYALLSEKTGLKFDFVAGDDYNGTLDMIEKGEVPLIAELPSDYRWSTKKNALLTKPFLSLEMVMVYSPRRLDSRKIMAIGEGYYLAMLCEERYGDTYIYKNYPTSEACLEAIQKGEADCTIVNSLQAEYYLNETDYSSLSFMILPEFNYDLSIGISKNADHLVASIMSKAVSSIEPNAVETILSKRRDFLFSYGVKEFTTGHPVLVAAVLAIIAFLICLAVVLIIAGRIMKKKNKELEKANHAKSDFLSRMSHDIRTPMNAIIGMSSLGLDECNEETAKRYFSDINTSGHFLLGLINDILDISKIENGKLKLTPEPYAQDEFRRTLDSVFQPLAMEKSIKLVIDMEKPEQGKGILVDKTRFVQIFFNLLSNSMKFTPPGGIVTFTETRKRHPDGTGLLLFTVKDTGCGISQDFQKQMFDPFSQEQRSGQAIQQGTGLGLSIVKSLVTMMKGTITCDSTIGKGTTFTVTLPVKIVDVEEKVFSCPQLTKLQGKHVLLVEDHPLNQMITRRMLEKQGAVVTAANNGAEAVQDFLHTDPQFYAVILMDIRMPVMDGLAATKTIRSLERPDAKTIPIIAMTANAFDEDYKSALASGMNDFLTKPVDMVVFLKTLSKYL